MLVEPKIIAFCQNLLLGMSKRQAAKQAGVSNPAKLLTRPDVQEYMIEQQQKARNEFRITRDEVLQGFLDAAERAKVLDEPNSIVNAYKEIGRMLGYYEPETKKIILSTEQQERQSQLERMNDADLLELAGRPVNGKVVDAEFMLIADDTGEEPIV